MSTVHRSCDWIEFTARSLAVRHEAMAGCSNYVARRLATLLLERLPRAEAEELVELLPQGDSPERASLQASAVSDRDTSIGHPDFVERAEFAIGCSEVPLTEGLAEGVADTFLETVAHGLPGDLRDRLRTALPPDLSARMELQIRAGTAA